MKKGQLKRPLAAALKVMNQMRHLGDEMAKEIIKTVPPDLADPSHPLTQSIKEWQKFIDAEYPRVYTGANKWRV